MDYEKAYKEALERARIWKYKSGMPKDKQGILDDIFPELAEGEEIDEEYKVGKWFAGLIPCWINAPSTLQPGHSEHGKNIVAIHLKGGGYKCCCVDNKEPATFNMPENTPLVEGWHNRE